MSTGAERLQLRQPRSRAAALRRPVVLLSTLLALGFAATAQQPDDLPPVRERLPFNDGWLFTSDDPADAQGRLDYAKIKDWVNATGAEFTTNPPVARPPGNPGGDVSYVRTNFNDFGWNRLTLPHDWAITKPFDQDLPGETAKLPYSGVGWYRKTFYSWPGDLTKCLYLEVDGAMSYANVWVNGQYAGGWPYGYSSWHLDITPYVQVGANNVLAIRLDNPPDSSRWYPGGGIYRNVWLTRTSRTHVNPWSVFITTPEVSSSAATVNIKLEVRNSSNRETDVKVVTKIHEFNPEDETPGKVVAELPFLRLIIGAGGIAPTYTEVNIPRPKLWRPGEPNRYVAVTTLEQNDKLLDYLETPFGIRTIKFTADNGFLVNGLRVPIQGVCLHHDLGALGAALNLRALERQLELLQEMGCNAIRTSHNPAAPELLDLCDRRGFLVMEEAFDAWRLAKRTNDYHVLFDDWHEKDLRAMVRRDRNHPSIILWSIGNEVYEQRDGTNAPLAAHLASIVREEDPTRPVSMALHVVAASTNGFEKAVDVFGYNYTPFGYAAFRANNPDLPLVGSETASCVSSRGEYFFPVSDDKKQGRANFQATSYDRAAPSWAMAPDVEFKGQDENPFVAGEFVWTGFDYLGEPTPFDRDTTNRLVFTDPAEQAKWDQVLKDGGRIKVPSRSSYFGMFDLCGFKKDRFYLYQARWRPDLPMAHILPHWNWWPERVDQTTPVHVYTSGDEAELFLNKKSLGRRTRGPFEYRLRWDDVLFQPGELKVIAYKSGKVWATDVVQTTGAAARIKLEADRDRVQADGRDLCFVTVSITDKEGLRVPRAKNLVRFSLEGFGDIVATDNGDATSHARFQSNERHAYNGLCLVIVRARAGMPGKITLKAEADGLAKASVTIRSVVR